MALSRDDERSLVNALNKLTGNAVNKAIRDILISAPITIRDALNGDGDAPTFSPESSEFLNAEEEVLLTNVSGAEAIRVWQRYTTGMSASLKFSTLAEGLPNGESDFIGQGELITIRPLLQEATILEGAVEVQIGPVRVRWEYD